MERNEWAHTTEITGAWKFKTVSKQQSNRDIRFQDKECILKNTQQLDMHNCKITGNFTLSQSQLYLLQFHWSFAVDPFLSLHFLKLCSRSSGNYLKSFAVLVLPHQTIALSMVQEWQYQVRLNPFLELRHRQKNLTHAIPHTPLIITLPSEDTPHSYPWSPTQAKQASKAERKKKTKKTNPGMQ